MYAQIVVCAQILTCTNVFTLSKCKFDVCGDYRAILIKGIMKFCPCNIFSAVKTLKITLDFFYLFVFLIFAQNIDRGIHDRALREPPVEAVLTTNHHLSFEAKIRKVGIPLHTPVM